MDVESAGYDDLDGVVGQSVLDDLGELVDGVGVSVVVGGGLSGSDKGPLGLVADDVVGDEDLDGLSGIRGVVGGDCGVVGVSAGFWGLVDRVSNGVALPVELDVGPHLIELEHDDGEVLADGDSDGLALVGWHRRLLDVSLQEGVLRGYGAVEHGVVEVVVGEGASPLSLRADPDVDSIIEDGSSIAHVLDDHRAGNRERPEVCGDDPVAHDYGVTRGVVDERVGVALVGRRWSRDSLSVSGDGQDVPGGAEPGSVVDDVLVDVDGSLLSLGDDSDGVLVDDRLEVGGDEVEGPARALEGLAGEPGGGPRDGGAAVVEQRPVERAAPDAGQAIGERDALQAGASGERLRTYRHDV